MEYYLVKTERFSSTRFEDIKQQARFIFYQLEKRTKRRPYVRSAYFHKEKIFLDYFWAHLNQKSLAERRQRLVYLPCAVELIKSTRLQPDIKTNHNRRSEVFYRFGGKTKNNERFVVQIKEDQKSGKKYFMSVFPWQ